ncbi:MAG: phosphoribosylanthranilate isomerase [Planctomycetota bacterium]|nr:phosphoribosylanthranilate isomerase [Planctomycetota bacterium]|tara:strand:- start:1071 stop:1706 length:636 start_codon:yes stop_codon:yes gene_type:complete
MNHPWNRTDASAPRIKICGIRDLDTALAAVESGADALGFVLAPGSPRTVSRSVATRIADALPAHVEAVGVFVDGEFESELRPWQPRWTQLHGNEDEALVRMISGPVIRAVPFDPPTLLHWDRVDGVDRLLVDSPHPGSGRTFDHAALHELRDRLQTPLILAGGLAPDTVSESIRTLRPWAVDVSSGVESAPGTKEPSLIDDFCRAVRESVA